MNREEHSIQISIDDDYDDTGKYEDHASEIALRELGYTYVKKYVQRITRYIYIGLDGGLNYQQHRNDEHMKKQGFLFEHKLITYRLKP